MKRFWVILFLFFSSFQVWSQSPANLGLKFGTNSSSLISNYNEFFNQSQINKFFAGAFVRINIKKLYIQPEVYFNTKGGTIIIINSNTTEIPDLSKVFSYQTIDIPILLGYKIINNPIFNFRIHVGPVLSFVTADPLFSEITNLNIKDLKNKYIGIQAGIGFDLWFITLDARIENSFNIFNNNSNYSAANRAYLLSAGIKFF
jgi:hypothetical protein